MGLDRDSVAFLIACQRRLGVDFSRTLTLGRQALIIDLAYLRAAFAENGIQSTDADLAPLLQGGYAEPFLSRLGADRVDSLDASDFEQSTIVHDLNEPLPSTLRSAFSVVLDGGTLEHVFDYPSALRNTLGGVRPGGHAILITPSAGYMGHGFYQFSPELFYRVLAPENGFQVECMLLKAQHWNSRWRRVPDPAVVKARVEWRGDWPALLYVLARRVEDRAILARPPMQSDYVARWEGAWTPAATAKSRILGVLKAKAPLPVREIRRSYTTWRSANSPLEAVKLSEI
jgi:hypothetical protein